MSTPDPLSPKALPGPGLRQWLRTICLVLHLPGAAIRHRLRPVSDGDRPYRSEQKFFRAGESTRAEGRFYSESPLSLAFFCCLEGRKDMSCR